MRTNLKVNGTMTFSGGLMNLNLIENTTDKDLFKPITGAEISIDNCSLSTAKAKTQLFYSNTSVEFSMHNCDIRVDNNDKQLWKCGTNASFSNFELCNNIFYSETDMFRFLIVTSNATVERLAVTKNTIANVYNFLAEQTQEQGLYTVTGTNDGYIKTGQIKESTIQDNLVFTPNYDNYKYTTTSGGTTGITSYFLYTKPDDGTKNFSNNIHLKGENNNRIRMFQTTSGTDHTWIEKVTNPADVITGTPDYTIPSIIPAGNCGAKR